MLFRSHTQTHTKARMALYMRMRRNPHTHIHTLFPSWLNVSVLHQTDSAFWGRCLCADILSHSGHSPCSAVCSNAGVSSRRSHAARGLTPRLQQLQYMLHTCLLIEEDIEPAIETFQVSSTYCTQRYIHTSTIWIETHG